MTREEITRMAREASATGCGDELTGDAIERFAALVVAAERNSWPAEMEAMERQVNILTDALAQAKAEEREACAKHAEDFLTKGRSPLGRAVAAAIRARGETK